MKPVGIDGNDKEWLCKRGKITQESGDSISADRLSISGDNVNTDWQNLDSNSKTRAGSYIGAAVEGEIRVVWSSESGETSSTLATFENPN